MKKLLLSSAALCGLAMVATPAAAQVSLELGGHFKGYGVYHTQDDDAATTEERSVDILRETEVHFGGETTLDNGLTVGVHIEAETDGADAFEVDESYAYFSGAWGRVNFGDEDGAVYLLQVEAPSADSNVDGIRQYIQPVNYGILGHAVSYAAEGLDYDNDLAGDEEKLTYLTPIMNGFQAGVSYTPDIGNGTNSIAGVGIDDQGTLGEVYEVGARYEGQFNNVGVIVGAGYTHGDQESGAAASADDFKQWNVGADLDIGPFGLGVVYTEENNASDVNDEDDTIVVGVDYTTGPFKLGASWLNNDTDTGGTGTEADRYTGGVVYTYGPGMTLRGSLSHVEHEQTGSDTDATTLLVGTQINF